jgi:hypothetical protein
MSAKDIIERERSMSWCFGEERGGEDMNIKCVRK